MAPQQLRCRDLSCGDVLLKVSDGSLVSRVIGLGQRIAGQLNPHLVHAGVMFDSTYMIEAQRAGVSANDLRTGNAGYGYLVFRCTAPGIANGAGTFAKIMFDIHATRGNLKYAAAGAAMSLAGGGATRTPAQMDDMLDRILAGRNHPYFCSQFVVLVYQFAAEQNGVSGRNVFPLSDAKVSPSVLGSQLSGSGLFQELGYLMPGER